MPNVLVPIIYKNRKYNMTEYLKKVIDNEMLGVKKLYIENSEWTLRQSIINLLNNTHEFRLDKSTFYEMNCFKKTDWKYEREWRLLAYNMNPLYLNSSPHMLFGELKPKAIYLGEKMSNYNKESLISIAQKKKIKIYQMYTKMEKNSIKLKYKEVK